MSEPGTAGTARALVTPGGKSMSKVTCSVERCERPAKTRGWCVMHYARWLRTGKLDAGKGGPAPTPEAERFWAKVNKNGPGGCWEWTAARFTTGYGQFAVGPPWRRIMAHRWAYEALVGPIPETLQIDHLCRNRACVNPAHLEPVTQQENILRGDAPSAVHARRDECVNGHPFTADNLYSRPDGSRRCRTCTLEYNRRSASRRRSRSQT